MSIELIIANLYSLSRAPFRWLSAVSKITHSVLPVHCSGFVGDGLPMTAPSIALGCPFHTPQIQWVVRSACVVEFDPSFADGYPENPPDYVWRSRKEEPRFFSPKLG